MYLRLFKINVALFLFLILSVFANTSAKSDKSKNSSDFPTSREIYTSIKTRNDQLTPDSYKADLQSPLINAQLKNLPKESRIFGKTPYVTFEFKKKEKTRLHIENVENYQSSFFSIYEDILLRSGMLLGLYKWNEYEKFIKEHQIFLTINPDKKKYVYKVKIEEKEALPGDYGEYYFSKDWDLLFSKYFINNKLSAEIDFFYTWQGNYRFVKKLKIKLLDKNPKREFDLVFKIK